MAMFSTKGLLLPLLAIGGVGGVGLAAWQAHASAARSIRAATMDRLTSLREEKRREIIHYHQKAQDDVALLAEIPWVAEAAEAFRQSFGSIPSSADDEALIETFYAEQIEPRISGAEALAPVWGLVPSDEAALSAQAAYIVRSGHPIGEKDELADPGDGSAYAAAHAAYHPVFRRIIETHGFYDLFLIDPADGRVVYSVFKEVDFGTSVISGPHRQSGLAAAMNESIFSDPGDVVVIDFTRYAPSYFAPASFFGVPVRDGQRTIAILVAQVPIDVINDVMTGQGNWEADGLGKTGETYLVGEDGKMRSDSRFLIESPGTFVSDLARRGVAPAIIDDIRSYETTILFQTVATDAARAALAGETGTQIITDYRGVEVISAYAPLEVDGLRWAILSEIDVAEAFAPIEALRDRIITLSVIVMALFSVLALVVSRLVSRNERLTLDQERIQRDISIAKSIQEGLLPRASPALAAYDIAGWSKPADETGGDYYDWQQLPSGQTLVTVADVTGHGIGPALVTAVCRAYSRACFSTSDEIGSVLTQINQLLHADLPPERFVTFVVALLEPETHILDLASAGHGPLFWYHAADGRVECFDADDLPLGITAPIEYPAGQRFTMQPGDMLLLMTDGFFEYKNGLGEMYGIERLSEAIKHVAGDDGEAIIRRLYERVVEFAGGAPQDDDLTCVVIKRRS